jgi:plasmid stability protein
MATITVKNIPDNLYRKLKESAKENHRSMNSEVILAIKLSVFRKKVEDVDAFLEQARKIRELTAGYRATAEEIEEAINAGHS